MVEIQDHRLELIKILQGAYSGEMAAAFAYSGHWRAIRDPDEKASIKKIEEEEWHHRRTVGQFLSELGSAPKQWREVVFGSIGRVLSIGCYMAGWYLPMYFAGRLEAANVREYEDAALHARALGLSECENSLIAMSLTEKEHENYFAGVVANRPLTPMMKSIFGWGPSTPELEKHD